MAFGEPSTLAADAVLPLLRGRLGRPYRYAAACESTQQALDADAPEGAVAVCDVQTAGRGRLGRPWEAPAGAAILCSVALRPPPYRIAAELSLVAGLAVAQAVEAEAEQPARIKWPNDVLLGDGKVAGVLAEMRGDTVVVGIGLNVNQDQSELPARPAFPAVSLRSLDGRTRERAPLFAALLARLEAVYDLWLSGGLAALLPELSARDALAGRRIVAAGARGRGAGIAEDGRLRLETDEGRTVYVAAGEVTIDTL